MSSDSPAEQSSGTERWRRLFPYDEPYADQADAINKIRDVATSGGYATIEAACGTGKTLMALDAGIDLVRDPTTRYQRVLCLTSVHQQLRAFEDDLKAINADLPANEEPVSAITLVGKSDLCAYTDSGEIDRPNIYTRCDELRTPVRDAMSGLSKPEQQGVLTDLVQQAEATEDDMPVRSDEWTSPYSETFPDYDGDDYCGFYARTRLDTLFSEEGYAPDGVLTPDDLLDQASANGLCPHAVMSSALDNAEVVIGNYQHIFNRTTVQAMTASLMDEETLLVCDEAHTIVSKAKDELSESLSSFALDRAIDEIDHELLNQPVRGAADIMWSSLEEQGIDREQVTMFVRFLQQLQDRLAGWVSQTLDGSGRQATREWRNSAHQSLPEELSTALRDPESPGQADWLTQWVQGEDALSQLAAAEEIGTAIGAAIQQANDQHGQYTRLETYSDTVGAVLTRWHEYDHTQYFRELELKHRTEPYADADFEWNRHYRAKFVINNCIPATEIADRLAPFGGGVLMSATLAPLDVFRETTGLARLDERGRHVRELTYGLSFPEANRESLVADLPAFTHRNRENPGSVNETRTAYVDALLDVVRETDGNVLVAMPNYREADWAATIIGEYDESGKKVLLDQSSSSGATEELKTEFFAGGPKILCTSMRGTITEGVDYEGDRLDACVVCGVPLIGLGGDQPAAVEAAYADAFGEGQAFDYAFTVPAVRKARQTWGRVIRGSDDLGVRVALDARYTADARRSVRKFLPAYEDEEFTQTPRNELSDRLSAFWTSVSSQQ